MLKGIANTKLNYFTYSPVYIELVSHICIDQLNSLLKSGNIILETIDPFNGCNHIFYYEYSYQDKVTIVLYEPHNTEHNI